MENRNRQPRDPIAQHMIEYAENLPRGEETLHPPQVSSDPLTFRDKLINNFLPMLVTAVGVGTAFASAVNHDKERLIIGFAIGVGGFIWSGSGKPLR